jgi:ATP-dependent Clp protease adapter protein ClpS
MATPGTIERPDVDDGSTSTSGSWVVVVFNNNYNTYDEVITILIMATNCSLDEAEIETWEIDHLGKSVVHHGEKEECQQAAATISLIGIKVQVSQE